MPKNPEGRVTDRAFPIDTKGKTKRKEALGGRRLFFFPEVSRSNLSLISKLLEKNCSGKLGCHNKLSNIIGNAHVPDRNINSAKSSGLEDFILCF